MTSRRAAALVARWVRCYTRGLPAQIAQRRVEEIDADLHDHIAYERSRGTDDPRIAVGILSRMARGLTADASWRWRDRPVKGDLMKSFVLILAGALGVIAIGVAAIVHGQADDAPGLILIGIVLIVGAFAAGVRTAQRTR